MLDLNINTGMTGGVARYGRTANSFSGAPSRKAKQDLFASEKARKKAYAENGYAWPQTQAFTGWPPTPNG